MIKNQLQHLHCIYNKPKLENNNIKQIVDRINQST